MRKVDVSGTGALPLPLPLAVAVVLVLMLGRRAGAERVARTIPTVIVTPAS